MTSDPEKCGISSLLPMSCRGKAEDFARRLHSRLRSLGSQDGSCTTDENSWLAANENPVAVSQPRHSSDSDLYFDFGLLESPGSPEEEITETEMTRLMTNNKDNLHLTHCEDCHCPKSKESSISLSTNIRTNSQDSDSSEGAYYDPESDVDQKLLGNHINGIGSEESNGFHRCDSSSTEFTELSRSNTNIDENVKYPSPTEEAVTIHSESMGQSEEESTLSLRDEDYPSLEYNSCAQEFSELESCKENLSESNIENNFELQCCIEVNGVSSEEFKESPSEENFVDRNLLREEDVDENCLSIDNEQIKDSKKSDEEADGDDERIPRVRRCSSLKTGKTPPGTPGRKKIVRFADVLGLDLADVRTFLDEIPKVPNSAYNDLTDVDLSTSLSDSSLCSSSESKYLTLVHKIDKVLVPLFQQPGGQTNFMDRVRESLVCLENAVVDDPIALSIKGTVRVRNLDFHKSVHIRYTLDSWKSFADLQGQYVLNSCDGFSDTFTFLLYAHTLTIGQRLEFAVRFHCKGCQYWDSNHGANYCFQCLPASNSTPYMPITGPDEQLGAAFYYQSTEDENT